MGKALSGGRTAKLTRRTYGLALSKSMRNRQHFAFAKYLWLSLFIEFGT